MAKGSRNSSVWITALGGVGEVGKNATLIECDGYLLLLDCGSQFPSPEHLGVDLIIPDFSYLLSRQDKFVGLVLTHAHEDHIGAVPFFLRQMGTRVDIHGTNLTLAMVAAKMRRHREDQFARFHPVGPGDTIELGPFRVTFFSVGHSIPDATAVLVETSAGRLFFTGDFKFSTETGEIDRTFLSRIGDRGVDILFSDCVRVENPGRTPPESTVVETLDRIIREAPGRVIIASFASNLSRVRHVLSIAQRRGRKVAVAGRGLQTSIEVGTDLGYIDAPASLFVDVADAERMPAREIVVLATGAQGEPAAALSRMAVGDHRDLRVREGDTVVLSSSPVPGNEESVSRTIDNLFRRGADVIWSAIEPTVHVSGHAAREELGDLVRLLHPSYAIPLHGEYRMQVLYRRLAIENGVAPKNVPFLEIGRRLRLKGGKAELDDSVPAGSILVDGLEIGGIDEAVLRDRKHLAEDGIVIVSIAMARDTGEILRPPEIIARGVAAESRVAPALEAACQAVERALRRLDPAELDVSFVQNRVHEVALSVLRQQSGLRPLVLPVVAEV
ncbi:MAG: ribonuclease J [Chloroflexota bacterium]|nr:MAG: ribonuclease J [Chloroflexota bacterium]